MPPQEFHVEQIDHVELFVPDRHEAAKWYAQVLGLRIVPQHEDWAADPHGPLMLTSDGGRTMIALFTGKPQGPESPTGWRRVSFRVDAGAFETFLARGSVCGVFNPAGARLETLEVVDHAKAFSVYFCDPWGNRLEVTSYDYLRLGALWRKE